MPTSAFCTCNAVRRGKTAELCPKRGEAVLEVLPTSGVGKVVLASVGAFAGRVPSEGFKSQQPAIIRNCRAAPEALTHSSAIQQQVRAPA